MEMELYDKVGGDSQNKVSHRHRFRSPHAKICLTADSLLVGKLLLVAVSEVLVKICKSRDWLSFGVL
ncbi:hypothetical protein YC2023_074800 [Brassica napus]